MHEIPTDEKPGYSIAAPEGLGRGYHEEIVRVLSRQEAVKIFCDRNANVTKVPYREHVTVWGCKNRNPARWRDAWRMESNNPFRRKTR